MRFANQGENVTPPNAPNLSERNLQFSGYEGNYENLQHDELVVMKYETIDGAMDVGFTLTDATTYVMPFWLYNETGDLITVTHGDGVVYTDSTVGWYNFQHDYTGWTNGDSGVIKTQTDGNYYFEHITEPTGSSDISDIGESIQYVYMSNSIVTINTDFLQHAKTINKVVTSSTLNSLTVGDNFVENMTALQILSLYNVTSIANDFGQSLNSLQILSLNNVISIGDNFGQNVRSLQALSLNNVTSVGNSFGRYMYSLQALSLNNITSIGSNFGQYMRALQDVTFGTATPPTVADANFLLNIPKSCIIRVPLASLTAYKTNTNMTHLADQMVGY